jgi:hypothetical protein
MLPTSRKTSFVAMDGHAAGDAAGATVQASSSEASAAPPSSKEKPHQKQRSDQARIRHAGTRSIVLKAAVSVAIGATGTRHGDA